MNFTKIKYFNYVYFSDKLDVSHIQKKNIVFSLFRVVGKSVYYSATLLTDFVSRPGEYQAKNNLIFFCMSNNNYLSLNSVFSEFPNGSARIYGDRKFNRDVALFVPTVISQLIAFLFFPKFLLDYWTADSIDKSRIRQGVNDIILSYSFYYVTYVWFKWTKPKGIVISNDHVYSTRILTHWANELNVPSFYIQHASVTKDFPALEVRHAFLDGMDAQEKYVEAGSDPAKIELIGIPKLDRDFKRINKHNYIRSIGIATNGLELPGSVLDLICFLSQRYPDMKLVLRPHRAQYSELKHKADLDRTLAKLPVGVLVSNPFEEVVMGFLSNIDCLIAGDSGIHVEAVLFNITSIYYQNNEQYCDDYGFVKNKLVERVSTLSELGSLIDTLKNNRPNVRYLAKKYCNTIDSEFDGQSSKLAASLIVKYI